MASKALPSPEVLRQLLRYEPETGRLYWLERPVALFNDTAARPAYLTCGLWNGAFAGTEAFKPKDRDGYHVGGIFGRQYRAHRVAWAIVTGEWPVRQVDHRDLNRANNRWDNLRLATLSQNMHNSGRQCNNTSGFKGVSWHKGNKRWEATIRINGSSRFLGGYRDIADAAAAYAKASAELHGEFGRIS